MAANCSASPWQSLPAAWPPSGPGQSIVGSLDDSRLCSITRSGGPFEHLRNAASAWRCVEVQAVVGSSRTYSRRSPLCRQVRGNMMRAPPPRQRRRRLPQRSSQGELVEHQSAADLVRDEKAPAPPLAPLSSRGPGNVRPCTHFQNCGVNRRRAMVQARRHRSGIASRPDVPSPRTLAAPPGTLNEKGRRQPAAARLGQQQLAIGSTRDTLGLYGASVRWASIHRTIGDEIDAIERPNAPRAFSRAPRPWRAEGPRR